MKVKIGNEIYDSKNEPIMLIFSEDERKAIVRNISNMKPKDGAVRKYLTYPDGTDRDKMREFMNIDNIVASEKLAYESDDHFCQTECPHIQGEYVGSYKCTNTCEHFSRESDDGKHVYCNFKRNQKEKQL